MTIPILAILLSITSFAQLQESLDKANNTFNLASRYIEGAFGDISRRAASGDVGNTFTINYTVDMINGKPDSRSPNYFNPIKRVIAGSPADSNLSCAENSSSATDANGFIICLMRPNKVFTGTSDTTGTAIDCNNIEEPVTGTTNKNGNANYYFCKNKDNILIQVEFKDDIQFPGIPAPLRDKKILFIGLAAFTPTIDFSKSSDSDLRSFMDSVKMFRCFNPMGKSGDNINNGVPAGFISTTNSGVQPVINVSTDNDVAFSLCFAPLPNQN